MQQNNANLIHELQLGSGVNTDFLFDILGPGNSIVMADELMISDADGVVLRISENYEKSFGFEPGSIVGQNVFDLEARGVFSPCISASIIREKKKIVTTQTIHSNHTVMTTGVPVFDDSGELKYAICFNTITMEQVNLIQHKYDQLMHSIRYYTEEILDLRQKNTAAEGLIFKSKQMQNIWDTLCYTANTKVNILITGETGVGKSAVAKAVHNISDRAAGPFIDINCAVIHENLIESELFGYERGAFTGASSAGKIGKIELSDHGTLFLDEIGDLPLSTQSKLLQLIQEKTIERISGTKKIEIDFRLIAATNHDLEKAVESGTFRRDLYYRLNVLSVQLPPLRERRADISPLVLRFSAKFNKEYSRNVSLSPRLMDFLEGYCWPGNVRQLENLMERMIVTCQNPVLDLPDLPAGFIETVQAINPEILSARKDKTLFVLMEEYERQIIQDSYERCKTSVAVARDLGISQPSAARKLMKYVKKYIKK